MGAMSSAFNTRRHRKRPSVNITSLIDVMFLLLIFFMVSSTFRHEFGVDVTLPEARTAVETEASSHEIVVTEGGAFFLGQREVTDEGLRSALSGLIVKDPEAKLVLRADAKADFGRVVRAMDIAREVGGSRLVIPTQNLPRDPPEN